MKCWFRIILLYIPSIVPNILYSNKAVHNQEDTAVYIHPAFDNIHLVHGEAWHDIGNRACGT